jgi:hypothetical protein
MSGNAIASVIVASAQSVAKVFVIGGIGYGAVICEWTCNYSISLLGMVLIFHWLVSH